MATDDGAIQLRPPGGGLEWDASLQGVRLATAAERRAAGVATESQPFVVNRSGTATRGGHA
ncbi:hypothetical protein ACFQ2B_28235 [Streptomyces stramineus]